MFFIQRVGPAPVSYVPGLLRPQRVAPASAAESLSLSPDEPSPAAQQQRRFSAYVRKEESTPRRRRMVYANELMCTVLVVLPPTASLAEVQRLFADQRFRHIPIVDHNRCVVGIISDRDLLRLLSKKTDQAALPLKDRSVEEILITPVLTATADTEIREIARVMFAEHVGCLPITEPDGRLVGIMTRTDILRALLIDAPLELWG